MTEPRPLSRRGFLTGRFLGTVPRPVLTAGEPALRAHVARVLPSACIAYRGTVCFTCREHCQVPGAIVFEHGRPRIDPDLCTGCGDCIGVCPAPQPAIVNHPRAASGQASP